MRIIRAVTDRRQIISFPFFVYKDTLEDKSYPVYSVETVSPDRCIQWRIQGRGPGPPLFLVKTEARRAEKFFFGDRPPCLSKGLDDGPPLSLRSGSVTDIQVSCFS